MRKRQGFTLVELLVSMALIMFIMSILSYAFVAATTTFRDLKAAGDMAEKLRSVTGILQRDLAADHFDGRRRLSDPTFWAAGPPRQGFFRIWQGSKGILEVDPNTGLGGYDLDGIPSYRSTNHALHFTIHLRGNRQTDYLSARVPAASPLLSSPALGLAPSKYQPLTPDGTFNSQWAEVVYFLRPTTDTANGTPLFALYRRQLLMVPDDSLVQEQQNGTWVPHFTVPPYAQQNQYPEISCWQGYPPGYTPGVLYFNSPFDVTVPQRRFGVDVNGYPSTNVPNYGLSYPILSEQTADPDLQNADLLLTDVVSFDVRVLLPTANTQPVVGDATKDPFVDLFHSSIQAFSNANPLFPAATGPQVFDTWTSVRDPLAMQIANLQPPLNAYAPLYDYSAWGQKGSAQPNGLGGISIPLWSTNTGPILKAIQVQIRIWDNKTQQTRQVTLVQAM